MDTRPATPLCVYQVLVTVLFSGRHHVVDLSTELSPVASPKTTSHPQQNSHPNTQIVITLIHPPKSIKWMLVWYTFNLPTSQHLALQSLFFNKGWTLMKRFHVISLSSLQDQFSRLLKWHSKRFFICLLSSVTLNKFGDLQYKMYKWSNWL